MSINVKRLSGGMPAVAHKNGGAVMLSFGGAAQGTNGKAPKGAGTPVDHVTPQPSVTEEMGAYKDHWVPWGNRDTQPIDIAALVRKSPYARPALKRRAQALYGQRQFTYKVTGYTDDGNATIQYVPCPEWEAIIKRSNYNAIRLALSQDFAYWELNYPEIMFNDNKTKVWKIDYQKTSHCRMEKINPDTGYMENVYVSGRFPNAIKDNCDIIPAIDFMRYPDQMDAIREDYKTFRYLMPQYWPDVLNDYYPEASWLSAKEHIEINNTIPAYKKALFRNQMSLKYHIQIPYEYLYELYPNFKSMDIADQDKIVDDLYDEIIETLTGTENAQKALLSFFRSGTGGGSKPVDGWIVDVIDDKMKNDAYLPDEAASASIIQFAFMQNPALSGQGNTGGSHQGGANNGGSNIRESSLDYRAQQQADRDICNSYFNFIRDFNGLDPELQLGTQDMVLTTLDTGAGTAQVVS